MPDLKETRPDDMLERVLLREVELARANEALRHEHFERRRIEKVREIFSVLGEKLNAALAPRDAALAILDAADQLFGWDAAFVDVYSAADDRFHPVVRFDVKDRERVEVKHGSATVTLTPLREQLFSKGPLLILRREEPDAAEEWLLSFGSAEQRSASLMFVPMEREGSPVGVLSIQSYSHDAYSQKDLDLLQALGSYCCHGLQRAFAETRMQHVQQKLNALIGMSGGMMWTADEQGRLLSADGPGWAALGKTAEDVRHQYLRDIFPANPELHQCHSQAFAGGVLERQVTIGDRTYRCRMEPLFTEVGGTACCLGVLVA
jgi:PAS domain-containing protein